MLRRLTDCYCDVVVEPPEKLLPPKFDAGPDPVWAVGMCIVGLLIMGIGGAATWHWTFNIGEAILLLGMTLFLVCVAMSWNAQRKLVAEARAEQAPSAGSQDAA